MAPVVAKLSLEPIYGWGWTGAAPDPIRETPAPFAMRLAHGGGGTWQGVVQTPGHELDGQPISLSQRHDEWDGYVNVTIGPVRAPVTEGWARVIDHGRLEGKKQER